MAMSSFTTSRQSVRPRLALTLSFTFCSINWFTSSGEYFSYPADSSSSKPVMATCAKISRDCCDRLRRLCTTWRHYPNRACQLPTLDPPGFSLFSIWDPSKTRTIRNFFRYVKDNQKNERYFFYLKFYLKLKDYNITYEVNVSTNCPKPDFIQDTHFLRLPVNDSYGEKLLPYFVRATQFIGPSQSPFIIVCFFVLFLIVWIFLLVSNR